MSLAPHNRTVEKNQSARGWPYIARSLGAIKNKNVEKMSKEKGKTLRFGSYLMDRLATPRSKPLYSVSTNVEREIGEIRST